jgi:hypothetical protein
MKQYITVLLLGLGLDVHAQNVGIGTTTPVAGLHLVNDNGIVAKGNLNTGAVINETGAGSRFIFYPRKGAIRAGHLDGLSSDDWSDANIGHYSIGLGYNVKATNSASVAIGQDAISTGVNSAAIGYGCTAQASNSVAISTVGAYAAEQFSVAIGTFANANSFGSVALGRNINAGYAAVGFGQNCYAIGIGDHTGFSIGGHYATGNRGFAFGNNCRSVGDKSFSIGNDCSSGGDFNAGGLGLYSFALGNSCQATGNFSFAFGNNASTNGHQGSMVLGSRIDGVTVLSPADFHLLAQFAGGYTFQSNSTGTLGVYLNANTSSWQSLCDSNRKEQVVPMNDEETLEKLSAINYSSWKYLDDPDVTNRHYGIMAQDFYASFGRDALGKIGSDTLVNPIDLLGVAYSAIKALEKRTDEIEVLKNENGQLKARLEKLEMLVLKKK